MAIDLKQAVYLLFLLFAFYGCLKSVLVYKQQRDFKYLVILAFFLLVVPQLWMRAYDISPVEFFQAFQFILTVAPLLLFLFYDRWEKKRLKEERDKIKIKSFFESYVSPKIIDELLQKDHLELKGKRQIVTIFFMDIRGFTKMSEKLPAEQIVMILNKYFDIATSILFKYDGTIDKFVGDAVMAVFNAPTRVENHELKAVEAALEIQHAMKKWGKIHAGIGIHTGEAVVGNIGSQHKIDYTAIGDTVNTAARLEGQTKSGDVVVSKEIYEKVKHKYSTRNKEKVKLKGKTAQFQIYRYKTQTHNYLK